ncbi:MAG: hypothetical protein PQJ44_01500, partial [Sphaerochaetaceae bacterium]|nr:hypothetical protein [Sphaerochaetaceae bacterium]
YTLWYSKLENSSETSTNYSADTMQVSLFKETENLKYGVNYTTLNSNGNSSRELSGDQSQTVFYFENDKDTLRYSVAYVITGKKGGNVALDEDTDSDANFSIDEVGANDVVDGDVYYFGITKVFDDTAVEFKYLVGKGDDTAEEMYLSYNVQLDKNFFCYLSGNMWEKADESDSQKVEVGFNISF